MTQITLEAPWGSEGNSGSKFPNDGGDFCGNNDSIRVAQKFDITTLPAGATVTQVQVRMHVKAIVTPTTLTWDVDGYNGTGLGNPETDSAATMFAGMNVAGVYLNDATDFRTIGVKTLVLSSQANTDLAAARVAGTIFSVAVREVTAGTGRCEFSEYTDATAGERPALIIDYDETPIFEQTSYQFYDDTGTGLGEAV